MFWPILILFGSTNFSYDLLGAKDTRPGTWGYTDVYLKTITFTPPLNHHVRLLGVRGDFIAWYRNPTCCGGVLISMQTTGPDGSRRADYLADNCFLYYQTGVGREPARLAFNDNLAVDLLDNKIIIKAASWLNEPAQPIHAEVTAVFIYEFVPDI